jgi:hypothetical protein
MVAIKEIFYTVDHCKHPVFVAESAEINISTMILASNRTIA